MTMLLPLKEPEGPETTLEKNLEIAKSYLESINLRANESKTSEIISSEQECFFQQLLHSCTKETKYLGLIVDSRLF